MANDTQTFGMHVSVVMASTIDTYVLNYVLFDIKIILFANTGLLHWGELLGLHPHLYIGLGMYIGNTCIRTGMYVVLRRPGGKVGK
jgi:hypothetical protein